MNRVIMAMLVTLWGCTSNPKDISKIQRPQKLNLKANEDIAVLLAPSTKWRTEVKTFAMSFLGTPYLWGGNTREGIDCSGFTKALYESVLDYTLPRKASWQAREGWKIRGGPVLTGDLIFFGATKITHVGMALDSKRFIHADPKKGVTINSLKDEKWAKLYQFSRRYLY